MKNNANRIFLIASILLTGLLTPGSVGTQHASANPQIYQEPLPGGDFYLPIIIRDMAPPVFGVETYDFQTWKLDRANEANVHWVRNVVFSWADIEPTRESTPVYHWETVDDTGLIEAANRNLTVIATIKFTPSWAQKKPGWKCGPIAINAMDAYGQFVRALVERYSTPPYNIRYWEFGNEPDIDAILLSNPENVYGCWGEQSDPYYGGGYYAEMLKKAYPAVKSASPYSKVLIGGLLLDCDPVYPPAHKTCLPAKFLEGILRNNGAAYFDMVAFHTYAGYYDSKINDLNNPSFLHRGGQVVGKVRFLQSVLATFRVSKPIILTEVSLSCDDTNSTIKVCTTQKAQFEDLQADFVVSTNIRSWGLGLVGAVWYTLEDSGWRSTGLHIGTEPKPGYYALQYMSNELGGATVGAEITQYSGLNGYSFQLPSKRVWVLWAPDGVTGVQIPLPSGTVQIYDKFGNPIAPLPNPIQVVHPTYFEFPP